MKKMTRCLTLILALTVISCVTINIYFPAEELRGAADKIVNEVWGNGAEGATPDQQEQKPGSSYRNLLGVGVAYAAQDINVSTPAIRTIKEAIKSRSGELINFLNAGNAGLSHDGLLKIQTVAGLNLKQKGQLNKLIKAENQDRLRLYKEIAVANGFPDKTGEVQQIFAESWRKQAKKGWFLEQSDGSWMQK